MKYILIYGFALLLFISCESSTNPEENGEFGPCVHRYEDPVLAISSVSEEQTGNAIEQVTIFDIKIDSIEQDPSSFDQDLAQNISVRDSAIVCTIPCGFSTQEGDYQFSARTETHQDTTLSFDDIQYEVFDGGCPSSNSGSTEISFEMKPK